MKVLPLHITLCLLFIASCAPKKSSITKAQVMQERIDKKLNSWRQSFEDKCKRDILDLATTIVDSTLIANARANKDTVGRPDKPLKPDHPDFEPPKDSVPIEPLIKEGSDSLLLVPKIRDTTKQKGF